MGLRGAQSGGIPFVAPQQRQPSPGLLGWTSADGAAGGAADETRYIRFDTVGAPTTTIAARNLWAPFVGRRVALESLAVNFISQVPAAVQMTVKRLDGNFAGVIDLWTSPSFSPVLRVASVFEGLGVSLEPDWSVLVGMVVPAGSLAPSNYTTSVRFWQ